MASSSSISCRFSHGIPSISSPPSKIRRSSGSGGLVPSRSFSKVPALVVRASTSVDSYESPSNFVKRMEQAWLISKQPRPIACSTCESNGHVECKWCGGTGFFIIGNNMLCEVPSRNTSCIICSGKIEKIFQLRMLGSFLKFKADLVSVKTRNMVWLAVLIAKVQGFVPSGWGSLLHPGIEPSRDWLEQWK